MNTNSKLETHEASPGSVQSATPDVEARAAMFRQVVPQQRETVRYVIGRWLGERLQPLGQCVTRGIDNFTHAAVALSVAQGMSRFTLGFLFAASLTPQPISAAALLLNAAWMALGMLVVDCMLAARTAGNGQGDSDNRS